MPSSGRYGGLFIIYPDKSKVEVPLTAASLELGADAECHVRIVAPGVLPRHCRLAWDGVRYRLLSLGGAEAVWVNQRPTTECLLEQGDVVKVGECFLVYHAPVASGAVSSPAPREVALSLSPPGLPVAVSAGEEQRAGTVSQPPGAAPPSSPPGTSAAVSASKLLAGATLGIGRDPSNSIVLNHPQVSRFHAQVTQVQGQWVVVDRGSTNGTFVNGQRTQGTRPLTQGDHIRISDYSFFFDGSHLQQFSDEGNARIDAVGLRRVVGDAQVILHDVSLSILPREFVAVVGGSGAGKSTLVNALSGFRPADAGQVLFNGLDYYANLDAFRSTVGYVPQDDIIHTELTAEQALRYSAMLRMPEDTTVEERERRVDEVLTDLHLLDRRHVPVHRLSGGQRKRVSIGVELLTRPRLFYLDEPTSGLDPGMEVEMMKIFRQLADQGHTLILITHATRSIMLCDKIAFMARGGFLAFFGTPAEALQHFGAQDFADIYLKVDQEKTPQEWHRLYLQSDFYQRHVVKRQREGAQLAERVRQEPGVAEVSRGRGGRQPASAWRQLGILATRYLEILRRDRINLSLLLLQAPVLALSLLLIATPDAFDPFSSSRLPELGYVDGLARSVARAKIIVFLLTFFSLMCGIVSSVREIIKELPIYKRERAVNVAVLPYIFSKLLVLASVSALQTALFVGIVFSQVHPPPGSEDFTSWAYLILLATNLAGIALGLAVSAAVDNQNTAIATLPVLLLTQIVLSGALLPFKAEGMRFLASLTIMKFGFEAFGKLTRVWCILPQEGTGGLAALVKSATEYREQFDVDLGGHVVCLALFGALFLGLACWLQKRRDRVRD